MKNHLKTYECPPSRIPFVHPTHCFPSLAVPVAGVVCSHHGREAVLG
jgi:hypothetical protein